MRRLAPALAALFLLTIGCGDSEPEEGATDTDVVEAEDTPPIQGPDTSLVKACEGIKPDKAAEQYDDQCEGITACTTIEDPPPGPCWCAICGQFGATARCLKANCAIPSDP